MYKCGSNKFLLFPCFTLVPDIPYTKESSGGCSQENVLQDLQIVLNYQNTETYR
jgi:hypothetical protein